MAVPIGPARTPPALPTSVEPSDDVAPAPSRLLLPPLPPRSAVRERTTTPNDKTTASRVGAQVLLDTGGATSIDASLAEALRSALQRLGIETPDVHKILRLDEAVPDSAVARLRTRVLKDPTLAGPAGDVLRHYSAEALAKGSDTREAKLLRLEMLMLAVPAQTRSALLEGIRDDLTTHAQRIKAALTQREQPVYVEQLIIGGGPQGQTIANALHRLDKGAGTIIVDATRAGDGNFASVRSHLLNSATLDGYRGLTVEPGGSANPVHGGAIQVEDLEPTPEFPTAGGYGDAATIGLYCAFRRGTDVLAETTVEDIVEAAPGANGRYLVSLRDEKGRCSQLATDIILDVTGLGTPSTPLADQPSRDYVVTQTRQLTSGAKLASISLAHSQYFLQATNTAPDAEILDFVRKSPGDIAIVGWGDSGKTPLLRLREVAMRSGTTVQALLGERKILWIGPKSREDIDAGLWGPYAPLREYFDDGTIVPLAARLQALEPSGDAVAITLKDEPSTRRAGRVILAMGMASASQRFLKTLVPSLRAENKQPINGQDRIFGDGPLASRLVSDGKEHDIFFAGMTSGIERPTGYSFLEFFGWKNLLFAEQVLAPRLSGKPSPFAGLRSKS